MNKLDLDITKYSDHELRDIFDLGVSATENQINGNISGFKASMLSDNSLTFSERENAIKFLDGAMQKLGLSSARTASTSSNIKGNNLTFSATENTLVPNTSDSHPLVEDHNVAAGAKAKVYEGRSERWYPPGGLNPINIRTIKRTLNIDTRFRDNYYATKSTNFHINLPETFNKVVNMQLDAFEIPLSIYAINSCNNCFTIRHISDHSYIIDLSYGNYTTPFSSVVFKDTSANMVTVINKILSEKKIVGHPVKVLGEDISYNIDPISGRSIFDVSTNDYELIFNEDCEGNPDLGTPLPLKLGWLMGYRAGTYPMHEHTKVFSEGIANFAAPKYIYICINDFTNASDNVFVAAFNQSTMSPHIIARIQYQGLLQNAGLYNSANDDDTLNASRPYYGPVNIQKLQLSIRDEYGQEINFNNMDWSCSLSFDILYS